MSVRCVVFITIFICRVFGEKVSISGKCERIKINTKIKRHYTSTAVESVYKEYVLLTHFVIEKDMDPGPCLLFILYF